MKLKIVLILLAISGWLAAGLIWYSLNARVEWLEEAQMSLRAQIYSARIVVLKESMPAGAVLARTDLKWRSAGCFEMREQTILLTDDMPDVLVGKKLMVPVEKRRPILWSEIEGGDPRVNDLPNDGRSKE